MYIINIMRDILIITIILTIIDITYLKLIGGKPFIKMVENIQNEDVKMNYISAFIAYILLILLVYIFIIKVLLN